jgi:hypothetical protein
MGLDEKADSIQCRHRASGLTSGERQVHTEVELGA